MIKKYTLYYSENSKAQIIELKNDKSKIRILKDVLKALRFMEIDLRHPSLCTHEFESRKGPNDEKMFEAYAQNETPGAYRIFWYYSKKERNVLKIVDILPHP